MPGAVTSANLVGRVAERSMLDDTLARVMTGTPAIVIVGGDAGIGKSRLVAAFGDRAREQDARVPSGRA